MNRVSLSGVKQVATGFSQRLVKGFVLAMAMMSVGLSAQTISPQMIEQVKNLPRAQQEALAKQYGVDLDQILGGAAGNDPQQIAMPGELLDQRSMDDDRADEADDAAAGKIGQYDCDLLERSGLMGRI